MPQSWEVTVTGGGKTLRLESAQPDYAAVGTPPAGLDLEAVYVGLGSEADFVGKDVKGKAVFVFNQIGLQLGTDWTVLQKRADAKGAAAIFEVDMLPGNMRYQAYPSNTKAPAFTVGSGDGFAVRDLFAALPVGQAPRVKQFVGSERSCYGGADEEVLSWCTARRPPTGGRAQSRAARHVPRFSMDVAVLLGRLRDAGRLEVNGTREDGADASARVSTQRTPFKTARGSIHGPPKSIGATTCPKRRFEHGPLGVSEVHAVEYDGDPNFVHHPRWGL
jgi:hypothetical protein